MLGAGLGNLGKLGVFGLLGGAGASDPGPDSVLATLIDGAGGNGGYPGNSQGQGANAHILATGAVKMDGSQVVYLRNRYTGAAIGSTVVVRAVDAYDDHNSPAVLSYPNGAFLFAACGHGADNDLKLIYRAPDGTETAFTRTFANTITYPRLYVEADGTTRIHIRVGATTWVSTTCANIHSVQSFPVATTFADDADQLYVSMVYNSALNMYYGPINPNSSDPEFGGIRLISYNPATNVYSDGAGPLSIPFAYGDVAEFSTPTAGRQLQAQLRGDGQALFLLDRLTADVADVDIYIWKFTGANYFNEADWTKSAILYSDPGLLSVASGYNPGRSWETAPHDGYRFYVARRVEYANVVLDTGTRPVWVMEKWDNPSGDLATWDVSRFCRHIASTSMIVRPTTYHNASDDYVPVTWTRFNSFTDYNNYALARIEWGAPWREGEGVNFEADAAAYFARCGTADELFKSQVNSFCRVINELGIADKLGFMFIAPTVTQTQRETSVYGTFTATSPSKPAFTARTPAVMVDPAYYDLHVVPGVDAGITQNNHNAWAVTGGGNAQGGVSLGAGGPGIMVNPRNASDLCQVRSAETTTDTSASSESRGSSGVRRAASGSFVMYTSTGGAANSKTRTSAAFDSDGFYWGATNNNGVAASFSGRSEYACGGGPAFAATTGNTPLDICVETLVSLLEGETS